MIKNFSLQLLSGGFYRCSQSWNRTAGKPDQGLDQCYKFYFSVGGSANVFIDGINRTIESGYCYFLSGFDIEKQYCQKDMDVYWIHFIPESLYFRYMLSGMPSYRKWAISEISCFENIYTRFDELFGNPFAKTNSPATSPPAGLRSKTHSLLLYLTGDMLEAGGSSPTEKPDAEFERLKPSIDFMDDHFIASPSLAEVAGKSHLAPNYFHRIFSKKFNTTPLNYMTRRKLEYARQLLCTTTLSVKEISGICGYDNEFYFSRSFKKYLGTSPSGFRRIEWMV